MTKPSRDLRAFPCIAWMIELPPIMGSPQAAHAVLEVQEAQGFDHSWLPSLAARGPEVHPSKPDHFCHPIPLPRDCSCTRHHHFAKERQSISRSKNLLKCGFLKSWKNYLGRHLIGCTSGSIPNPCRDIDWRLPRQKGTDCPADLSSFRMVRLLLQSSKQLFLL